LEKNALISGYEMMKKIRYFEESLCDFIENGEIKTPCHLYIGQEAIATGICSSLRNKDLIWGNHRSHGHYIAKGGDLQKLMDEIFCKESGCSGGRGGSMHIFDNDSGIPGTVPIVAGTIPLAVGSALAFKMSRKNDIAVAFFGDGSTEEGHVIESMNIAALYELPILFVIENNLYSSHMHVTERRIQEDLQELANMNGIEGIKIDGNDYKLVAETSEKIINEMRKDSKPRIMECMTFRWRGHVGPSWDEDVGVKRKDELSDWIKKDPIQREYKRLLSLGVSENLLLDIDNSVKETIDSLVDISRKASFPDAGTISNHVFKE
jgi:acetoin:2,6-dichlorophenolindophenol oxidoreductase subunit alpha